MASPFMTKALVEHLNLQRSHTFSIQTLGDNGVASPLVETRCEAQALSQEEGGSSNVTTSSEDSSTHAQRRVFLAIYDYSPSEQPNKDLAQQVLAFRTGDVIHAYGDQRNDGYYMAKVHGKKGLVPSSYIEEVAVLKSKSKRSTSSGGISAWPPSSVTSSNGSLDRSSHLTGPANHSSS